MLEKQIWQSSEYLAHKSINQPKCSNCVHREVMGMQDWTLALDHPSFRSWTEEEQLQIGTSCCYWTNCLICCEKSRLEEKCGGFLGGRVVKNPPANAGDTRDMGLILGLGRSLEKEMTTHSNILACKLPWTEEPGGLQSMESQKSWMQLSTYTCT